MMMAEESNDGGCATSATTTAATTTTTTTTHMIDEVYEFSAPRFFDFTKGESEEDMRRAERWFHAAQSHAPSPFMPRIKTGRSFKLESLCDFSEEAEQMQKVAESSDSTAEMKPRSEVLPSNGRREEAKTLAGGDKESNANLVDVISSGEFTSKQVTSEVNHAPKNARSTSVKTEVCSTPKPAAPLQRVGQLTNSKKHQSAKHIASLIRNPSALKPKSRLQSSQAKGVKPESVRRGTNAKSIVGTPNLAQENQACKRQKLEGGKSRQILNLKPPQPLPHKSKLGISSSSSNLCSSSIAEKKKKQERKVYVRNWEQKNPFVSMAEMMKKFQSSTRDLSLPNCSLTHTKSLTLTRPKEPEFETAQRVRSVKVKSSAELEEEMMAKIPKFKARPLNRKMMETPTLPTLQRSTPQLPEFQEFNFQTRARAKKDADTASVASTEMSIQSNQWKAHLTEPKTPILQTSLRARPPAVKSSFEIEKEELEKIPKFKAKPLNKKIFESKGELGIFCNEKKQVTVPQEFHFATNERIPPPASVVDLFDKLSLNSEPHHDNLLPRNTAPNPFHLHTEARGAEKERRLVIEIMQKQLQEEKARVPKANPYPYTTDCPVVPPKPEPKPCTKPEPFQLESLVRHEEEMHKEMKEKQRKEKEEARMRIFKAQPVLQEDPIPVPEKVRKPLTQVQQFNLHVDDRAVDRAEFDRKVKEKEMIYKRYREESETAKMLEEEKALKQLRRTMVPQARPVPKFDRPFCPQKSSKEITKARSPNLHVLRRNARRKTVMMMNPVSSPASCMR